MNKNATGKWLALPALLLFAAVLATGANAFGTLQPADVTWPDNGYIIDAPRVIGGMPPGVVTIVNPTVVNGPFVPPTDATWPDMGRIIGGNGWLPMGQ